MRPCSRRRRSFSNLACGWPVHASRGVGAAHPDRGGGCLQPLRDEEATARRSCIASRWSGRRSTAKKPAQGARRRVEGAVEQIQQDAEREDAAIAEARELLARFDREEEAIRAQGDGSEAREEASERAEVALAALSEGRGGGVSALTAKVAELRAERRQLKRRFPSTARALAGSRPRKPNARQVAELRTKNGARPRPSKRCAKTWRCSKTQLETLEGNILAGRGSGRTFPHP